MMLPSAKRRMLKSPKTVGAVLCLVSLVILTAARRHTLPLEVTTVSAARSAIWQKVSAASVGHAVAERQATLRSYGGGHVVELPVRVGDRVARGDAIAVLDASEAAIACTRASATVQARRAELAVAREIYAQARAVAARDGKLACRGAEPAVTAQTSSGRAREAGLRVRAAEAKLDEARAGEQEARQTHLRRVVRAPFAGVVAAVCVRQGDDLAAAVPVATLVDDTTQNVQADLDEADLAAVRVGQKVTMGADALGEHALSGTVARLAPTVSRDGKGARRLRVEVALDDASQARERGLRPGMSLQVEICVGCIPEALVVASHLVGHADGEPFVYLLRDGQVKKADIKTGVFNWDLTQVIDGLDEGDQVVSSLPPDGRHDGVRAVAAARATL